MLDTGEFTALHGFGLGFWVFVVGLFDRPFGVHLWLTGSDLSSVGQLCMESVANFCSMAPVSCFATSFVGVRLGRRQLLGFSNLGLNLSKVHTLTPALHVRVGKRGLGKLRVGSSLKIPEYLPFASAWGYREDHHERKVGIHPY